MMRRLFVISDLHLGGRPDRRDDSGARETGFQICNSYAELSGFIDWIVKSGRRDAEEEIELVINGDVVDFLAEDDFTESLNGAQIWTTDDGKAVAKLDRIWERAQVVFDSLKNLLAAGNRLTLLLGNHDVELSLPAVRERLAELLGGNTTRLRFIYDGEAYTAGRVLIEHGNRYDRWNMIDHSALRQERSMRSRRLPVKEEERESLYFIPPAGTYIVVHFMNRIKSMYRFIDLLKPEDDSMIPLLLALEPDRRKHLKEIMNASPVVRNYLRHGLRTATVPKDSGDLEALRDEGELTLEEVLEQTLGEEAKYFAELDEASAAGDLATMYDDEYDDDLSEIVPPGAGDWEYDDLGIEDDMSIRGAAHATSRMFRRGFDWFNARCKQFNEKARSAVHFGSLLFRADDPEKQPLQLYAALKHLNRNDRSFDIEFEHDNYLDAAVRTATEGDFDAIIYGHTHLPKKISLSARAGSDSVSAPGRWYLNTGTWCDVIRLPDAIMGEYEQAEAELKRFVAAVRTNNYGRYVRRYLSFVEILVNLDDGQLVEEPRLCSYCGSDRERSSPLTDILQRKETSGGKPDG